MAGQRLWSWSTCPQGYHTLKKQKKITSSLLGSVQGEQITAFRITHAKLSQCACSDTAVFSAHVSKHVTGAHIHSPAIDDATAKHERTTCSSRTRAQTASSRMFPLSASMHSQETKCAAGPAKFASGMMETSELERHNSLCYYRNWARVPACAYTK
jgi:hypothetical protein